MSVAIFAALLLASVLFFLWFAQERIVFQPPRNFSIPESDGARRIEYAARDGQRLLGYFIESPHADRLLLCFHGNADLAAWQIEWAREAARRTRHSVFFAEYRGYFGLQGKPTYLGVALDADAAYQCALETAKVSPEAVSFFGHSLGSAVAGELALRYPGRRLLLQAPFTSARAMGRLVIGRPLEALWNTLSRVHFDTERVVGSISTPVSVSHGTRDRVVPVKMGEAVFAAARVKGRILIVPGAGHNDVPEIAGEDYWQWLSQSLA